MLDAGIGVMTGKCSDRPSVACASGEQQAWVTGDMHAVGMGRCCLIHVVRKGSLLQVPKAAREPAMWASARNFPDRGRYTGPEAGACPVGGEVSEQGHLLRNLGFHYEMRTCWRRKVRTML